MKFMKLNSDEYYVDLRIYVIRINCVMSEMLLAAI